MRYTCNLVQIEFGGRHQVQYLGLHAAMANVPAQAHVSRPAQEFTQQWWNFHSVAGISHSAQRSAGLVRMDTILRRHEGTATLPGRVHTSHVPPQYT